MDCPRSQRAADGGRSRCPGADRYGSRRDQGSTGSRSAARRLVAEHRINPLPDRVPLAGRIRGGRGVRPAAHPFPRRRTRPRQRRAGSDGAGRSGACRLRRAVDSNRLPSGGLGGLRLVDGLVVDNLPIDVAKVFGAGVWWRSTSAARARGVALRVRARVASRVNELLTRRRYRDLRPRRTCSSARISARTRRPTTRLRRAESNRATRPPWRRCRPFARACEGRHHRPRPAAAGAAGPAARGDRRSGRSGRGTDRVTDRLVRHSFNIPVGPGT